MTGVLLQQGLPCNEAHLDHRRLGTGPVDIPAAAGGVQPHLGSSLSRPLAKGRAHRAHMLAGQPLLWRRPDVMGDTHRR
jgi:hypothetical protein